MKAETQIRRAARKALADALRRRGRAWHNAADSLESQSWGNTWTEAALDALERTATQPLDIGTDND